MKSAAAAPKVAPTCLIAAETGKPFNPVSDGHGYTPYHLFPRHHDSAFGAVLHGGGHRRGHHDAGHRRH